MDDHAYHVLPLKFRKAFEEVNGEMPESEFIREIWMDIAMKWFGGWCLAIEHADELRPNDPPLPAPVSARKFILTVVGDCAQLETVVDDDSTATLGLEENVQVRVSGMDEVRMYQPEYVRNLQEMPRPDFQQEPPFQIPAGPVPCPVPPPPAPNWSDNIPKAPMTAAEAAAESVQKPASTRIAVIIPASYNDGISGQVWLIGVNGDELRKVSRYNSVKSAKLHAEEMGYIVSGYEYHMTRDQIRYWQENPTTTFLCKNDATPPGIAYVEK